MQYLGRSLDVGVAVMLQVGLGGPEGGRQDVLPEVRRR